jgi:hypothetical protein
MSRDAIAEVLGRLDYGDQHDEVDWRDRLREADELLAAGVVVDVEDLITGGSADLWHDLRRVLHPLGWRVVVSWGANEISVAWAPPHATHRRIEAMLTPYVEVDAYGDGTASAIYYPPIPVEGSPEASLPVDDDWITHHERTADALLAWLATP